MKRDYGRCPNRCMVDCRANLRGGECKAPFIEESKPPMNNSTERTAETLRVLGSLELQVREKDNLIKELVEGLKEADKHIQWETEEAEACSRYIAQLIAKATK